MGQPLRLLLVEDCEDDALLLVRELRHGGYDVEYERVETPAAMHAALEERTWDIVISDYSMPHFSAPDALRVLQESEPSLPFIILSGTIGEETAVAALKAGANDFLTKGKLARLVPAVERELREAEGRRERRVLEEQLRQAQKMEAVGRLAGGIAHDFNNMLGAITGYTDLVLSRPGNDESTCECLRQVMKAAERAAALTRQLLVFSRKQAVTPQVLDLNEIVAGMRSMLRRLIDADIELIDLTDPALGRVKADPGQIEQVLMNLAVNARDAMPQGGTLTIETRNVERCDVPALPRQGAEDGDAESAGWVMLSVTDTGCGMDAETQSHIFEPFFTTKEEGKGTGLGLATVYGIAHQSGGRIAVASSPGQGATFRVYFPRVEEAIPQLIASDGPAACGRGSETILLVEDDPVLRVLVCKVLQASGYTVLEAGQGEEALQLCAEHPGTIHLLLTDVVMPGLCGRELAERAVAARPEMKVVLMSGYTEDAILRHGVCEAEMVLIQKPFKPAALIQKVCEVLEAESAAPVRGARE